MTAPEIVQLIMSTLTSGITTFAQAIGGGISAFAKALAFEGTGENTTASVFFILILAFAGVALVVGLTTRVFLWLSSLGKN